MKRTQKYAHEPLGLLPIVTDLLPPPQDLVLKEDGVKITIALSRRSVDFFKARAADAQVPYQKMIRALVDRYAEQYGAGRPEATPRPRRAR
jgi:hypothetical protein